MSENPDFRLITDGFVQDHQDGVMDLLPMVDNIPTATDTVAWYKRAPRRLVAAAVGFAVTLGSCGTLVVGRGGDKVDSTESPAVSQGMNNEIGVSTTVTTYVRNELTPFATSTTVPESTSTSSSTTTTTTSTTTTIAPTTTIEIATTVAETSTTALAPVTSPAPVVPTAPTSPALMEPAAETLAGPYDFDCVGLTLIPVKERMTTEGIARHCGFTTSEVITANLAVNPAFNKDLIVVGQIFYLPVRLT